MLFEEEDAALLKKWIIKRLEDMYVPFFPLPHLVFCSAVLYFETVAMLMWKKIVPTLIRMFWRITCLPC